MHVSSKDSIYSTSYLVQKIGCSLEFILMRVFQFECIDNVVCCTIEQVNGDIRLVSVYD